MTHWEPIDVISEQPYQVIIGKDAISLLPSMVDGFKRVALIYPPTMATAAQSIAQTLSPEITHMQVPDGEAAKTPEVLTRCWLALSEAGFTRSDAIVGIGGGTTTDLAGFVAASWLRGVRYISVPTTVLGMVDAAVGGKTGINLPLGKNLVGAFYEPYSVLGDVNWLATLTQRDLRSGFAEALKAGFIADPDILDAFEADPALLANPDERLGEIISKAVRIKAKVVQSDFRESVSSENGGNPYALGRESLNYGHTLGHAIEVREDYRLRHGEAVSIGMVFAAEVALRLSLIDEELVARHRSVLALAGLPTSYDGAPFELIRESMRLDKKTRGSNLRLVLLNGLRRPMIAFNPEDSVLLDAFLAIKGG
ncbi:MAG: 3-dehydroquinate synthase [Propionibacteriaceae bacterium]|jgi:3-dehydroquinate synthase|nr:3-dehydroquinate synthase [Propionibacteriaceae bacterium]